MGTRWLYVVPKYPVHNPFISAKLKEPNHPTAIGNKASILLQRNSIFNMRVLVIGGSGQTGRLVIDEALQRGHKITALIRNPLCTSSQGRPEHREGHTTRTFEH